MTYLLEHPLARAQLLRDAKGRPTRRARPADCTVVHTAEGVLDGIAPDIGAEATADCIRRRAAPAPTRISSTATKPCSWCPTRARRIRTGTAEESDWARLSPRAATRSCGQGARAFARQQQWLRARGYPTTPLRRLSRTRPSRAWRASSATRPGRRLADPHP